jgi:hypothetical protein
LGILYEGFFFSRCLGFVLFITTTTTATTYTTATATTDVQPVETCYGYLFSKPKFPFCLTLILLMWRIGWANNSSRWQMGFNLAFKGLIFEDLMQKFIHVLF